MWVHACFYCAIYKEHWALISFGDICVPACHCICSHTLTIPPAHTLPYYPTTESPLCPLSQTTTIGGGLPPSIMCARRRHFSLARRSTDLLCLRHRHHLHHDLPRSHTRPRTHTTPLYAITLHSHLLPATPLHLIAIPLLATNSLLARTPGLVPTVVKDSATVHIHTNHSINTRTHPIPTRLGKVFKRALVVPPLLPSPKSVRLWDVHRHRAGWRLVGVLLRSTFRSSNSLGYIV